MFRRQTIKCLKSPLCINTQQHKVLTPHSGQSCMDRTCRTQTAWTPYIRNSCPSL